MTTTEEQTSEHPWASLTPEERRAHRILIAERPVHLADLASLEELYPVVRWEAADRRRGADKVATQERELQEMRTRLIGLESQLSTAREVHRQYRAQLLDVVQEYVDRGKACTDGASRFLADIGEEIPMADVDVKVTICFSGAVTVDRTFSAPFGDVDELGDLADELDSADLADELGLSLDTVDLDVTDVDKAYR